MARILNIPFGVSFLDALARGVLERSGTAKLDLSDIRILLPTRRATRILRERFLAYSTGKPLILPRLSAIGDVDADELDLWLLAEAAPHSIDPIPPAIQPFERVMLLATLIGKQAAFQNQPVRAFALAQDLARLMDSVAIEDLSFDRLSGLVPADFAAHWQITTEFLSVLWTAWPAILQERGVIEPATRRNLLLRRLAAHWARNPPQTPVIAAGITGTIPATIDVLQALQQSDIAEIILPGLDTDLPDNIWQKLPATHPQHTFKELLQALDVLRKNVELYTEMPVGCASRAALLQAALHPAPTEQTNPITPAQAQEACAHFHFFEAESAQQEARAIALLLRETLETPHKTAAFVTPDPALAKRVSAELMRWSIRIDNSAGRPATESPLGDFLLRIIEAAQHRFAPTKILSVVQHPLCWPNDANRLTCLAALDTSLRGLKPGPGFEGLRAHLATMEAPVPEADAALTLLADAFGPLENAKTLADFITAHVKVTESLCPKEILWRDDGADAIAPFLQNILGTQAPDMHLSLEDYATLIASFLSALPIRKVLEGHPRLAILGPIEARILQCDRMILGGLNEAVWPPPTRQDPWMSRPMRAQFGLPPPEREIGLSALDFTLSCGAADVFLTRAKRAGDAPAVPSRWWQRLRVTLKQCGISQAAHPSLKQWLQALDEADQPATPITRPAPKPPLQMRPNKLSVTQIETLLRDPYAIYARHILRLKPLDDFEMPVTLKNFGIWLHDLLHDFVRDTATIDPTQSKNILLARFDERLAHEGIDAVQRTFWHARADRALTWFIAQEYEWRKTASPVELETRRELPLKLDESTFTLHARPDRIDRQMDGTLAIIDYKSSKPDAKNADYMTGLKPQLPLEALIAARGHITGKPESLPDLQYWILHGKQDQGGEIKAVLKDVEDKPECLDDLEAGVVRVLTAMRQAETPFYALPVPALQPKPEYQDYVHLARVAEWSVTGDDENASEDAA